MVRTYIVYADVVFCTNFLLDGIILWATARFGHLRTSPVRLALGAGAGSLYAVMMIYPQTGVLNAMSLKIIFSFFIVALTFPRLTLKKYLQATGYFYLISFAMAGAVLGGNSVFGGENTLFSRADVTTAGLVTASLTALALGAWGIKHLKKNWQKSQFRVPVQIVVNKQSIMVEALIDTGNDLRDPLSGKPVMIIEYQEMKSILPLSLQKQFERYGNNDVTRILQNLDDKEWITRIRLIPFNSIGKHHGMLVGFKPDRLVVFGKQKTSTREVVICLYHKALSAGGAYKAVMNPEMLEDAV